tara:strand:- start:764 stop:1093 length:330 start_codon:yes stop_codon:yes gene_type:complete
MYNRFDLEEAIMHAWTTCDDINVLLEDVAKELPQDQYEDALLGVSKMHHVRMAKIMEIFEYMVKTRAIRNMTDPVDPFEWSGKKKEPEQKPKAPKVMSNGRGGVYQILE